MPKHLARITRRAFLLGSASAAGLALYSSEVARHEVSIVTQPISLANLPAPFANYRVVQISDIHFDEFTEPAFLRRIVANVNSLAPDLVLLTGDFVSMGPLSYRFAQKAAYPCAELLRSLACPLRYAVLGNHDVTIGAHFVTDALAQAGIPVLDNRFIPIERAGTRLWLAGVADPSCSHPDLDLAIPAFASPAHADSPVILMCHGPDYADDVLAHPRGRFVSLMVAGHSHGGQVRFPFLRPMNLPPMGQKYVEGYFRLGPLQLYVNRGIGTTGLPFRLNCPPEITLFTLHSAAQG